MPQNPTIQAAVISAYPIPKRLHFCWYGGLPISELSQQCMRTWQETMPDYSIERWDESRLDKRIPYIDLAYRAKKYAFVADYVRLMVLYKEGGIYLDTDVEVLRPFDELLDNRLFFGFQSPGSVGAGIIGAVSGHPFLKLILDKLDGEARSGKLRYQPLPELVTALFGTPLIEKPALFPEEYFYPYNPYSQVPLRRKPLQANISKRTFCIHHWEGTWLGTMSLRMMLGLRARQFLRRMTNSIGSSPATSL